MRITRAEVTPRQIPLTTPYLIANRYCDMAEILFVTLTDETGLTGYGAGSPVSPLTGDDFDIAARALHEAIIPAVAGTDVSDLTMAITRAGEQSPGTCSAMAALDIALHDLHAKRLGIPLVTMLGGARRRLITSVTVGIGEPEAMAQAARRHVENGFRAIKVKIGQDSVADLERLRLVRDAVGPEIRIRVDANEGYDTQAAADVAQALEGLKVELFEQPVAVGNDQGMLAAARATTVHIVADESVKVSADLEPLLTAGAARGVNIKLMKCGGILQAFRLDRMLAHAGWLSLIGCMDESRVSIAAAAHFAAAAASTEWIDLDGHLDLAADPFSGGFEIADGAIVLGDAPGLGVTFEGFGSLV